MRSSVQTQHASWQGLGIALTYDDGEEVNRNRPGEIAAMLCRLGGRAPVAVLVRLMGSNFNEGGGPEDFLIAAVCDAPDAFEWYSV